MTDVNNMGLTDTVIQAAKDGFANMIEDCIDVELSCEDVFAIGMPVEEVLTITIRRWKKIEEQL